jgi:hypothetical protein
MLSQFSFAKVGKKIRTTKQNNNFFQKTVRMVTSIHISQQSTLIKKKDYSHF